MSVKSKVCAMNSTEENFKKVNNKKNQKLRREEKLANALKRNIKLRKEKNCQ